MDTVVAILNYNGRGFLEQFLPTLLSCSKQEADIVVIDNDSSDDSLTFLRQNYPHIKLVILSQNYGFAGGYNEGLKDLNYKYYLLLNSDIEVTPHFIGPLKTLLDQNPNIACVQPKIRSFQQKTHFEHAGAAGGFLDFLGYPFCQGRLLNAIEEDLGQYEQEKQVFWTTGACMLVRKEIFDICGGFDADFFAHMEEIDLCWRIQQKGFICFYTPKSTIYHVGGGTLPYNSPRKVFLNFRNNLLMLLKNMPLPQLMYTLPFRIVLDLIASAMFLLNGNVKAFMAVLEAHISFYMLFRKTFQKRQHNPQWLSLCQKSLVFQFYILGRKKYADMLG